MSKVQGLDKWQRQIRRIPQTVKDRWAQELQTKARDLAGKIRAHVPHGKTGALAKSVNWCHGLPPSTAATGAFRVKAKDLTDRQGRLNEAGLLYTVYEGDNEAYYGRWVEFGTKFSPAGQNRAWTVKRSYSADGKDRGTRRVAGSRNLAKPHHATKAQPHFYPIVRLYGPKIRRSIVTVSNRALREAARK